MAAELTFVTQTGKLSACNDKFGQSPAATLRKHAAVKNSRLLFVVFDFLLNL